MRLEIRRSESTTLRFQRKDAAGSVIMDKPDDIFFTVKKHYEADQPSIQKKLSDGGILFDASTGWYRIELTPADTEGIPFGTYYFDIKMRNGQRERYIKYMTELEISATVTEVMA